MNVKEIPPKERPNFYLTLFKVLMEQRERDLALRDLRIKQLQDLNAVLARRIDELEGRKRVAPAAPAEPGPPAKEGRRWNVRSFWQRKPLA
jgi:hypothetical protein